jgi:hypothetical protein
MKKIQINPRELHFFFLFFLLSSILLLLPASKTKRRNSTKTVIQVAVKIKRTLLIIINKSSLSPMCHQPKYQVRDQSGRAARQASKQLTHKVHGGGVCQHHREGQALEIEKNITKLSTKVHQAYAHAQHNTTLSQSQH